MVKRASLLRRDSVHGRFNGTIRVDVENEQFVINGNPVQFIYANSPSDIEYSKLNIKDPIVIKKILDHCGLNPIPPRIAPARYQARLIG